MVRRQDRWQVEDSVEKFNGDKLWTSKESKAHYAAVSGKFENVNLAGSLLGKHIVGGYSKENYVLPTDAEKSGNEFSMYWVEKGAHKDKTVAEDLASIIQQSDKNKIPVNWLVHDAGTATFKEAAKILKQKPLADAGTRAMYPETVGRTGQCVYFSNPSISSEKELKKLCVDAGMKYVGMNTNNRDLKNWTTLRNVAGEMGKATLKKAGTGGVAAGAIAASAGGLDGIPKVAQNAMDSLLSGNYYSAALAVGAGSVMVLGAVKKLPSVRAAARCTFGKGNQYWYADDSSLLSA